MTIRIFYLLLQLTLVCASRQTQAQARENQDSVRYQIRTEDGNRYYGRIIDQGAGYVLMATDDLGTISIPFNHIVHMERVDLVQDTRLQAVAHYSRPYETTYHFAPNGYGLKKGEGYYQNAYLFINQFYAGVTDFFSLGGGLVLLPVEGIPVWVTPRFSIPIVKEKIHLGIGSLNGLMLNTYPEHFGVFYTNLTFGPRQRNFSIGAGKGYSEGFEEGLAFSVSGSLNVSQKMYIITENYNIGGISVGTVGGRYAWPNISIEYSFVYVREHSTFIAFPYIGLIVPFGHKNERK